MDRPPLAATLRPDDRPIRYPNDTPNPLARHWHALRHLLAIPLEAIIAKRAKENHAIGVKIGASVTNSRSPQIYAESDLKEKPIEKQIITPMETRQEVAKLANVSHDTIAKVKKIEAVATLRHDHRPNPSPNGTQPLRHWPPRSAPIEPA